MNYYHGHQYIMPNPKYIYNVKPSVNHWQLRDLIHFDNGYVYYNKHDVIRALDLESYQSKNYVDLKFFPRCFNIGTNGVLVTGGLLTSNSNSISKNIETISNYSADLMNSKISKGLFSFHNPSLNVSKTVRIGEVINNDVTIYQTSQNSYSSYVCNNDSYLYCVDISNNDILSVTNKINCEINTCLNNVAKNPTSNKILTVTGDSKSIFIVDPTSHDPLTHTIKSGHELGFGISYHPNGHIFSTVFQDGSCLLYDLRNLSKNLLEIKSTRHGHQLGAFRTCKFSPADDLNDLLIISEHVGRIHVIDLRLTNQENVNDHQVIVVPYALEQHADYINELNEVVKPCSKKSTSKNDNDLDVQDHFPVEIFNISKKNYPSFPVPLIYDYDYLTENPRIFKDFNYIPPPPTVKPTSPPPKFTYPVWENTPGQNIDNYAISPTSSQRPSVDFGQRTAANSSSIHQGDENDSSAASQALMQQDHHYDYPHSSSLSSCDYDKLHQPVNQIQGEMEIAGIAFSKCDNGSKILIGGQESAILEWNINNVARRSFSISECA
jgi:hypothetical protein